MWFTVIVYSSMIIYVYWVKYLHVRPWSRQPGMWKQRCRDCLDEKSGYVRMVSVRMWCGCG